MSLDGARESNRLFITRVGAQVTELSLKRYPGDHPGPRQWLAVVAGVLTTAKSYLDSSEDSARPLDEALSLVRDAGRLAILAYDCLGIVSGASTDDLPYPVVAPMQRWFERLGLDYSTIFRAELVANYEIRTVEDNTFMRIRDRSPELDAALAQIRWPLRRITVPSRALGMLPHFAIVAHEIGHALFSNVAWDFSKNANDEAELINRIQTTLGLAALPPELTVYVRQVFINWLQELAADAFGLLVAGPAFFFALFGFLQAAGAGVGISESHPANALRRDFLFRRLNLPAKKNFASVYLDHVKGPLEREINSRLIAPLPPPTQLTAELSSQLVPSQAISAAQKAVVLTELTTFLEAISDSVYDQAEQYLKSVDPQIQYTPERYDEDLSNHLGALISAIPPIESSGALQTRTPTDFATILNVGWVVLLAKLGELSVRSESLRPMTDKAEKLHSLLLKAVELSEARRAWESAQ